MTEQERKIEALIQSVGQEQFNQMLSNIPKANENSKAVDKTENDIREVLTRLGVPSKILGYDYLATAIYEYSQNGKIGITTKLYPMIAHRYQTTVPRVERSIRHAIGTLWLRANIDTLNEIFGNSIKSLSGVPTNGEFIDRMARVINRG